MGWEYGVNYWGLDYCQTQTTRADFYNPIPVLGGKGAMRNPRWQKSDPGNENVKKRNMLVAENGKQGSGAHNRGIRAPVSPFVHPFVFVQGT